VLFGLGYRLQRIREVNCSEKTIAPLYKALIWHLLKWNLGLFWAFLAFFSLLSLTDHLFHEQDREFVFCALENFAIDRLWY
jgi:hypothetical protein